MTPRFEQMISGVLAVSAVAIAGAVVYRQVAPTPPAPPVGAPITLSYVDEWPDLLHSGRQIAFPDAPVQIVEFIDLECPGCRIFAQTLDRVLKSYDGQVGAVLVHYPLEMHPHARQAARAAECAIADGKFAELVTIILQHRDSLQLDQWVSYAVEAGLRDTVSFRRCQTDTTSVEAIERGIAAGTRVGIRATPTVIVSGWRFSTVPIERELRQTIDEILDGKTPSLPVR